MEPSEIQIGKRYHFRRTPDGEKYVGTRIQSRSDDRWPVFHTQDHGDFTVPAENVIGEFYGTNHD